MSRRRHRLKKNTRQQLRAAAMHKWRAGYTKPAEIAAVLNVPEWWIQRAIERDVVDVLAARDLLGKHATADEIATACALPRAFVAYCMRRSHGIKHRRQQGQPVGDDRARGRSSSNPARTTSGGAPRARRTGRRAVARVTSQPSS